MRDDVTEPDDDTPKLKKKPKPRPRTIEVAICAKDLNDPQALLVRTTETLQEKQLIKLKFVVKDAVASTNEQLEAKVTQEVGEHLDKKPAPEPSKPDEPAVDMQKVDEARGRIRRQLQWLTVNGIKLGVKAALDWAKQQVKSALG